MSDFKQLYNTYQNPNDNDDAILFERELEKVLDKMYSKGYSHNDVELLAHQIIGTWVAPKRLIWALQKRKETIT